MGGMTRSRSSAKAAGSRFERQVADYLRDKVSEFIDRRVKTGAEDKGDIANVRTRSGARVVVECKDVVKTDLGGWIHEAEVERENDGALIGVVVHKRRGHGDPGESYVTMTLRDLALLLQGM